MNFRDDRINTLQKRLTGLLPPSSVSNVLPLETFSSRTISISRRASELSFTRNFWKNGKTLFQRAIKITKQSKHQCNLDKETIQDTSKISMVLQVILDACAHTNNSIAVFWQPTPGGTTKEGG